MNKVKSDDILYIKSLKLPLGLKNKDTDLNKFVDVFSKRLKIIWHSHDKDGILRI